MRKPKNMLRVQIKCNAFEIERDLPVVGSALYLRKVKKNFLASKKHRSEKFGNDSLTVSIQKIA